MVETSVHGAVSRKFSGERPNRSKRNRPPPPPPCPRDLISTLPDAVIHHIFSFLPLEDVVKTSVLSKRWRSIWTTTAHLDFHVLHLLRPRNHAIYSFDFSSLVDSVLARCTSPAVKRFHITDLIYEEAYCPKLDLWLRFAEGRRAEDLRLWLCGQPPFLYKLPRFLYFLNWLVRLEVRLCCFSLGTRVRRPCLKALLINSAELSDGILEGIFRGSPVLESLELNSCKGVKNIVIDSTSVKELVLVHSMFSNTERLWAPHLLSLRVSGYWPVSRYWPPRSVFRLDDVSSLVEAELDFVVPGDERTRCGLLKELFKKLRGVPTITIDGWCLQFELDEESKERFNFDEEDFLCHGRGTLNVWQNISRELRSSTSKVVWGRTSIRPD